MLRTNTNKWTIALTALSVLTAAAPACDGPDNAEFVAGPEEGEANELAAPIDDLQEHLPDPSAAIYPFTIFNPDGYSKNVRVTAEIKSGPGVIKSIAVTDASPFVELFDMACQFGALNTKKCQTYKYSLPCKNYGYMTAHVEYTGWIRPTLHYWFDNC